MKDPTMPMKPASKKTVLTLANAIEVCAGVAHELSGSDTTTTYGAVAAGLAPDLNYDSPYNTHLHTGLPPVPISTVNANSLAAAAHPAATDWLFFVTGDDGTTHFSHTVEEHEALTAKYCHELCSN